MSMFDHAYVEDYEAIPTLILRFKTVLSNLLRDKGGASITAASLHLPKEYSLFYYSLHAVL